jgi:hypothetical protein
LPAAKPLDPAPRHAGQFSAVNGPARTADNKTLQLKIRDFIMT